jgi:hypothetical protein
MLPRLCILVVIVCLGQSCFHIVFGDFGDGISGLDITLCMIFLAFCGDDYTGRNVIGYTDVIQVFFSWEVW